MPEGTSRENSDDDARRLSITVAAAMLRQRAAALSPALARHLEACAAAMLDQLDAEEPPPIF